MVEIRDKLHFREALRFAKTLPKDSRRSLRHSFTVLNRIKRNYCRKMPNARLVLAPDWVKHSFFFAIRQEVGSQLETYMHGGLILHGFEETLSIELCPKDGPHWSIHT